MMTPSLTDIVWAIHKTIIAIIAFRTLPMAIATALDATKSKRRRLIFCGGYLALCVYVESTRAAGMGAILLAYAWCTLSACSVPYIVVLLRRRKMTRLQLFLYLATLFLAVPSIAAPADIRPVTIVVGWDIVLSAYSYAVEHIEGDVPTDLGECLFFLLVNPVLVFPQRGSSIVAGKRALQGIGRTALGLAAMFVAECVAAASFLILAAVPASYYGVPLGLCATGISAFLILYLRHSALASFQIGLMSQFGIAIPERYNWPVFATSPFDFWKRWNTYISSWAQRYLFFPTATKLVRRARVPVTISNAIGVAWTFLIIGLLHDVFTVANSHRPTGQSLLLFAYAGALTMVWAAVDLRYARRWRLRTSLLGASLGRLAFAGALIVSFCIKVRIGS